MKKKIRKSKIAALFSLASLGMIGMSKASSFSFLEYTNEVIKNIVGKFMTASAERPEDRVYLHLDKTFYKPGETIWLKAYLRNGSDLKASKQSDIVHLELINPKGSIEKQIALIAKNGLAFGDFLLDESSAGGLYKIKAYTNWQKNEEIFFEKELQVQAVILPRLKMKLDFDQKAYGAGDEVSASLSLQTLENKNLSNHAYVFSASLAGTRMLESKGATNAEGQTKIKFKLPATLSSNDGLLNVMIDFEGNTESISRSIPIVLNTIELSFYPEGGELVAGLENKLAFKALNEFGKPADVEGVILDEEKKEVASFHSFHQGMGAVDFKPVQGGHYTARITKPANIKTSYEVPEALERGYTLHVEKQNEAIVPLVISSTEQEELSIVAQVRGEVYYTKSFQATVGKNYLLIPVPDFPIGVAQFTLFDSKGIARAERLVFVNKHKQLNISMETDKEKYLPREKVTMTIKVSDERGLPMPANLSLSVADDKLLTFADDKQGNILSSLLLEYDLKEKIEEPAFYFNTKESKSTLALDYLLMTSGWRRFTWEEISENNLPAISYTGEKTTVAGTVYDAYKASIIAGATVEVLNTNLKTTTDKAGRFSFKNLDLAENVTLVIKASGYANQQSQVNEYGEHADVYLYDITYFGGIQSNPAGAGALRGARNRNMKQENIPMAVMELDDNNAFAREERAGVVDKIILPAPVVKKDAPKPEKKEVQPKTEAAKIKVADLRMQPALAKRKIMADTIFADVDEQEIQIIQPRYYRARVFASPDYSNNAQPEVRTDFRSTIYWNGSVQTDRTGKTTVSFFNSDEITSFRAVVEGIATDGSLGRAEKTYFTQLPFSMQVKVPVEITTGDLVSLPLILKNNSATQLRGKLTLQIPSGMQLLTTIPASLAIEAGQAKTLQVDFKTGSTIGIDTMEFAFEGMGLKDAFAQEIKISPKGFPAAVSLSGQEQEKEYSFEIDHLVEGSMEATFTAYPSVVSDLMKGIESILREPYGCFEQTSTSNYPNIMVKQYINEMGEAQAPQVETLLDKGYKRLITFETKEKGYEWFGGTPAHEGLTAYGLMQFSDMKRVYNNVDGEMIQRTEAWLLSRRDGNGGFKRSAQALDQFGRASEDITNAYIVYALSETGNREIRKELDKVYAKAMESKDPYQLALTANALLNFKEEKNALKALEALYTLQKKDGSWTGASHSITYSQGNSLTTETTSLAILAMIKSGKPEPLALNNAVKFLVGSRSGHGGFSSTQGTVLALKALTEYAKYSKKTDENGTIEIWVDGKKAGEKNYTAGEREAIIIGGLEKYFSEGKHTVRIVYKNVKNPLPYSMSVQWNTSLPSNDKECKVSIDTKLSHKTTFVGETVRLTTVLKNTTSEGLPMTMAIVGIPAGLSAQPWQLKELTEKKKIDFYEIRDNNIFFYYRQMLPEETHEINLDLKAEIAGEYEAQASSGYLYYTNEYKVWSAPERITVKRR